MNQWIQDSQPEKRSDFKLKKYGNNQNDSSANRLDNGRCRACVKTALDRAVTVKRGDDLGPHKVENIVLRVLEYPESLGGCLKLVYEGGVKHLKAFILSINGLVYRSEHRVGKHYRVGILIAVFLAGDAEPLTAAVRNVGCVLLRNTGAKLGIAYYVVVYERGRSRAVACKHVTYVRVEFRVHIGMPHNAEVVVVAYHIVGLHNHEAHLVGRVVAVLVASAKAEELTSHLEEHLGEIFSCLVAGKSTVGDTLFVKLYKIAVESAVAVAVSYDTVGHDGKLYPLYCLVVGGGRIACDISAGGGYLQVKSLLRGIALRLGKSECSVGVLINITDYGLAAMLCSEEEVNLSEVFEPRVFFKTLVYALKYSAPALSKAYREVGAGMAVAVTARAVLARDLAERLHLFAEVIVPYLVHLPVEFAYYRLVWIDLRGGVVHEKGKILSPALRVHFVAFGP